MSSSNQMTDPAHDPSLEALEREAEVFTRYLIGQSATEYIITKYRAGHHAIPYRHASLDSPTDRLLTVVARSGRLGIWLADPYARVVRPQGALRQKLVLLAAILESSPSFHRGMIGSQGMSRMRAVASMLAIGVGFAIRLALASILLGPPTFLSTLQRRTRQETAGTRG